MAYIVLLSVILLSSTISVGKEIPPLELCIIGMSSHYSSVSQYCTSHSIQTRAKEDVCKEIFQLFDKMCSFNISATAFHKPEPQNVSETNCVPLCAELDTQYVTLMFDGSTGSCKTLCTKDLEAVAVLSTLFQLKDVIAGLKEKEKQLVETVTNSTLVELQQSTSSSGAVVNASIEPNAKPTTAAMVTVPIEPNAKPTTAVTKERMVPSTKPGVNTVTTAAMHPSSTKATEKSTTATDATVKKTTLDVKPTITAGGENDSSPNEADRILKPVITAGGENDSSPNEADRILKPVITAEGENDSTPDEADRTLKPVITVATEKNPASNVKPTTTEHEDEDLYKNDNSDGLNKDNEILSSLENKHSNTNEEEETSRLDGTSNIDEKDETSRLDDTPSSYHFLIYFLAFIVLCVAAYIVFHNKHKIIAFIIEGKQGRRGGRPSTKQYTPLKSKVEDVMPFIEKSTSQSNYIY